MSVLRLVLAFALFAALTASRADAGGDRTARRLRRSALASYSSGAYAEAARDFRASYEIEPHPELLYALGQSLRLSGDCTGAIDAYQDFLITGPEDKQAAAAREKIEVCRQVLAPTLPPEPAAPARRTIARPLPPAAPAARPSRSWVRDPVGGALFAGGVVAAATGTWLVVDAADKRDEAGEPAHGRSTAGGVLLGVGGGMIAAAIVRYALVRRDRRDEGIIPAVTASIDPETAGAGLWVTGRF